MPNFTKLFATIKALGRQESVEKKTSKAFRFSSLPKETQDEMMGRAAKRLWEEQGSVIERLAHE